MKNLWTRGICSCFLAILLCWPMTVQAASVSCTLNDELTSVLLTIDDNTPGYISFSMQVLDNPYTGDLRGLFFDIPSLPASLSDSSFSGTHLSRVYIAPDKVVKAGSGNVITPGSPFDVGLELGTPGMAKDDIQQTAIQLDTLGLLTLGDFTGDAVSFGIRLTSVGSSDGPREFSSKLRLQAPASFEPAGDPATSPVPLPASLPLIGAGLVSLGVIKRRTC